MSHTSLLILVQTSKRFLLSFSLYDSFPTSSFLILVERISDKWQKHWSENGVEYGKYIDKNPEFFPWTTVKRQTIVPPLVQQSVHQRMRYKLGRNKATGKGIFGKLNILP